MAGAATVILRAYLDVCTFRRGPQDLPAAGAFLALSAFLYGSASAVLMVPYQPPALALVSGVAETLLLLLLTYVLLQVRGLLARFRQTASALAGTGFLFSLFALPVYLLRFWSGDDSAAMVLAGLLLLCLVVWNIGVMAHILRNAMATSFPAGVLLAIGYIWLITSALTLLAPTEGTA